MTPVARRNDPVRRRRRVPLVAAALTAGCLTAGTSMIPATASSAPGSPQLPSACSPSITALPMPAGDTYGDVLAVTGNGRIAAGFVAGDDHHQTVAVWHRRSSGWAVRDLGDLGVTGPDSGLSATGVNARGQVAIGVLADAVGGWVYTRGAIHQLTDFAGGTNAYARAINDEGEIVGEALDAAGNDFGAVWSSWSASPVALPPLAGYDGSFAQGVDDQGVVVGGSFAYDGRPQLATKWSPGGRPTALTGLGGDAAAWSVNESDRVVGQASDGTSTLGVVWNSPTQMHRFALFSDSTFGRALDVAPNGYVVGFEGANPAPPAIPIRHILFWPGHGPVRSLLPLSRNWADGAYSHTLDDAGDVYGASSRNRHSFPQPTVWTCALEQSFVPPPAG